MAYDFGCAIVHIWNHRLFTYSVEMIKYMIAPSILTMVLGVLYFIDLNLPWSLHPYFIYLVVFFFLQSLVISWILSVGNKDAENSSLYTLGSVVFRLLSGLFFLLSFMILKTEDLKGLAIQFVVLYLLYLIFELTQVLSNLRQN